MKYFICNPHISSQTPPQPTPKKLHTSMQCLEEEPNKNMVENEPQMHQVNMSDYKFSPT